LQASREIGSVPCNGGAFVPAAAGNVADDYLSRCDADTGFQLLAVRGLKSLDCSERLEACPNGTLGVVLISHRPSEICKHAVSEIFGDVTAEASDCASNAILITADQLVHILRVELRR
jgi:hypothetical protein